MAAPAKVLQVALMLLPLSCSGVTLRAPRSRQLPGGEESCRDAAEGEWCYQAIMWLRSEGMQKHPDWYPSLSASSSLSEFQAELHRQGKTGCAKPCAIEQKRAPYGGEENCYEAKEETDPCFVASAWAKGDGVLSHPEWYPGLSAESPVAAFHMHLFLRNKSQCPEPPCSTESTKDALERVWEAHGCNAAERCKRRVPPTAMTVEQTARFVDGWDGYLMATAQEQREWDQVDAKMHAESAALAEPRSAENPPASVVGAAAAAEAQVVSTTAVASGAADMMPKVETIEAANATAAETKRAADVASEAPAGMVAQPAPGQREITLAKQELVSDEALPVVDQDAKPQEAAEAGAQEEATGQRPQEAAEADARNATSDENLPKASPKSGAHEEALREEPQDAPAASSPEQVADVKPQEASRSSASEEAATQVATSVDSQAQAASVAEGASAGGAVAKSAPDPARANLAKQEVKSEELVSDEPLPLVDQDAADAGADHAAADEKAQDGSKEVAGESPEDAGGAAEPLAAGGAQAASTATGNGSAPGVAMMAPALEGASTATANAPGAPAASTATASTALEGDGSAPGVATVAPEAPASAVTSGPMAEAQARSDVDVTAAGAIGAQAADSAEEVASTTAGGARVAADSTSTEPGPEHGLANLAKEELVSDEPLPLVDQDAFEVGAAIKAAEAASQPATTAATPEQ